MDNFFDNLCRTLATRMPRSRALKLMVGGLAGVVMAPFASGQNNCGSGCACARIKGGCCPPGQTCYANQICCGPGFSGERCGNNVVCVDPPPSRRQPDTRTSAQQPDACTPLPPTCH